MRLLDRDGETWRTGDGWPVFVELGRDEHPKAAAAAVSDRVLVALHRFDFEEWGLEPPRRNASTLRRELEKRLRRASRAAPRSRLVPVSEAALELGVPQRTLRDQIRRGDRIAASVPGRRGRLELAIEVDETARLRVRLPRFQPDPRRVLLMARDGCRPGQRHRVGYTRARSGAGWDVAERLAGV